MPKNPLNMARSNAAQRTMVKSFPYSLNFPGTNAIYMTVGTDIYKFERTRSWTIGFIIGPVDYAAANGRHIFQEYKASANFRGWLVRLDTSGLLHFWLINTFATNMLKVTYAAPPIGTLSDCVFAYDGSSTAAGVRLWVKGVLQTQTAAIETLTGTIVDAGATVSTWGGWAGNTNPWKGLLGECFIDADRTWTQTEVDAYRKRRLFSLGTPTDVWKMTEGSSAAVASTGTGLHHGTLGAGITWDSNTVFDKARPVISQARLLIS